MSYTLKGGHVLPGNLSHIGSLIVAALKAANEGGVFAQEILVRTNAFSYYIEVSLRYDGKRPVRVEVALSDSQHNPTNDTEDLQALRMQLKGSQLPLPGLCAYQIVNED